MSHEHVEGYNGSCHCLGFRVKQASAIAAHAALMGSGKYFLADVAPFPAFTVSQGVIISV